VGPSVHARDAVNGADGVLHDLLAGVIADCRRWVGVDPTPGESIDTGFWNAVCELTATPPRRRLFAS
jgi:hypothetical protein